MDPNATLAQIRSLIASVGTPDADDLTESEIHSLLLVAAMVTSLDEWIVKGGFLPNAWNKN